MSHDDETLAKLEELYSSYPDKHSAGAHSFWSEAFAIIDTLSLDNKAEELYRLKQEADSALRAALVEAGKRKKLVGYDVELAESYSDRPVYKTEDLLQFPVGPSCDQLADRLIALSEEFPDSTHKINYLYRALQSCISYNTFIFDEMQDGGTDKFFCTLPGQQYFLDPQKAIEIVDRMVEIAEAEIRKIPPEIDFERTIYNFDKAFDDDDIDNESRELWLKLKEKLDKATVKLQTASKGGALGEYEQELAEERNLIFLIGTSFDINIDLLDFFQNGGNEDTCSELHTRFEQIIKKILELPKGQERETYFKCASAIAENIQKQVVAEEDGKTEDIVYHNVAQISRALEILEKDLGIGEDKGRDHPRY